MRRRYDSFLIRWWRLASGVERIEIEHIGSGEKALVANLTVAMRWIVSHGAASFGPASRQAAARTAPGESGSSGNREGAAPGDDDCSGPPRPTA